MFIQRENLLNTLIHYRHKDLVKIITGVRRCGKSILLNELFYRYLLDDGVQADHIIKIAFDMKKWENLRKSDELYSYLLGLFADDEKYYLLLDEIQMVEGFEEVLNEVRSEYNTDIYVTGSNSKLLSSDINTIFRGRGIEIKCFPLSFQEFYSFRKGDKGEALDEYILFGSLPYTVTEPDAPAKRDYLEMVANTVITRDMIERYDIRNEEVFRGVINVLCSSIGSAVSPNKIANTLQSSGYKSVDNETVSRYLKHIADAFLFYKVERYDLKGRAYLKTQNKYYACDMGLRNALIQYRQLEVSRAIENIVYVELIRREYIVDIGKNRNEEIDFIARDAEGRKNYIQVTYSIENPSVKERELSSFRGLDDGYKKILITMDRTPFTNLEKGYRLLTILDFLENDDSIENV
ncbi:MAG: ATP-binding protein [Christensenellales bacterium]|jgi:predicted AAA+ superfamily ATPase